MKNNNKYYCAINKCIGDIGPFLSQPISKNHLYNRSENFYFNVFTFYDKMLITMKENCHRIFQTPISYNTLKNNYTNIKQMKTKFLFLGSMLFAAINLSAQVGINTSNPQATFHVDGGKDNAAIGAPTAVQQSNDVVVTSSGNVGVGTASPSTRLEINNGSTNGAIKIVDGTQANGNVLTSDANGIGIWKPLASVTVSGTTPTTKTYFGTVTTGDQYMNASITLPKGKWMVYLGFLVNKANFPNSYYASRLTLSNSSSNIQETGFSYIAGNRFLLTAFSTGNKGASEYGFFTSGIIRVDVTTDPLTLYVWDNNSRAMSDYGAGEVPYLANNGENYLFAVRAN
ncbi:hypothetical protein [Chryseobacterium sp. IT-36CA2]|uniref:hypothetical protein n=1 Tax=Chryseobacterium sp. IT-36CA2 TaxID=3026460 RepID=UPI0039E18574